MKIKLTVFVTLLFSIISCSQESSKIAGMYRMKRSVLLINNDNTCFILGENSCVKGVVAINGDSVVIKPYIPEVPFVLYGRKNNNYHEEREGERGIMGNKIMFQNFESANAFADFQSRDAPQNMKLVLNSDSNCVDYPLVLENETQVENFYFAIKDREEVYEFETGKYTDFMVHYIAPTIENFELVLHWDKKSNNLTFDGNVLEKNSDPKFEMTINKIVGMYGRAFPESEYYYCNPAYNFFEENGIDVHSERYEKVENFGEYYYIHKYNGPPILHETDDTGDYAEADENAEYQSSYQINEYKKIEPKLLKKQTYQAQKNSLFTFTCDTK